MSVIACRILKYGFVIGADSQTTRGFTQTKSNNIKLSKLFEVNDMVIGGVGYVEELSLLHIFGKTHRPSNASEESLLEFLSEFSNWKNDKIGKPNIENAYLIGIDKKVFTIDEWMIGEVNTYEAIGAGMDFALSALYLGHTVKKAIKTAIALSVWCENPIVIIEK